MVFAASIAAPERNVFIGCKAAPRGRAQHSGRTLIDAFRWPAVERGGVRMEIASGADPRWVAALMAELSVC